MDAITLALAKRHTNAALESSMIAKIYGVRWDKGPSPTLIRTHDAVGMVAAAGVGGGLVTNAFDNAQIFREIGSVVDTLGNVFIRIPKIYIRKTDGVNFKTWEVSKHRYPGFYLPWCFWDFVNQRELPYIDVGKHKGTIDGSNRLESKPNLYPLISRNIVQFRGYAQANGAGYQQLDIHVMDLLQTLFYVEFATLNSQAIMWGFTTGQYTATHLATVAENGTNRIIVANAHADLYRVGQPISIGTSQGGNQIFYGRTITAIAVYDGANKAITFDGAPVNIAIGNMLYNTGWKNGFSSGIAAKSGSLTANDGKYPCVYRGIESPWGDVYQFVDGVNINEHQAWVAKNADDYASNVFASPYEQLDYINSNANGFVSATGYDPDRPFAALPTGVTAGNTTYYSDYYYQATGQRIAHFGGLWNAGVSAGLSLWILSYASSAASVYLGGRLVKKPL